MQSYIDEISQKNTIEDLRTLETRFNQYIDNTGNNINRASPDYINLLETFRTSIDTKKVEVEIS